MSRGRWITLVVVVAVVAAGGIAWALLRPQGSAEAQARSRTFTAQAETSTQTVTVGLTGTLSPQTQSNLNFPVSGTVTKVYVTAGDTVKKGQKLARIDDADLQDALELAEANLDTAEANLDDVTDDGTDAAVTAAEAQVESAKAAVASAEDDLDNAVLRSTIAGTVASVDLSVGDTVSGSSSGSGQGSGSSDSSTSAQVVVISTATWKLDGTVGSTDLGNLKAGQAVSVTPDGATDAIDGKVSSIGIVATSSSDGSATFPVVVTLDGEHPELFSGTTAAATITVAEYPDVLTVPTLAITTSDGKSVVTRVDGDATSQVEVTVGRVFGESTEVTAGLAAGDTVQISVTMPQRTDDTTSDQGGGLFGGGGGLAGGGGAPPDGGGGNFAPPNGGGGNR
ncbi:MAG: biotin/lipoyl-binding protein [Propionicimonas sp.]|nr:biotin/lipoyl-binding protein [Propionicimonas sp.]